jgi:hypothetical protein
VKVDVSSPPKWIPWFVSRACAGLLFFSAVVLGRLSTIPPWNMVSGEEFVEAVEVESPELLPPLAVAL